MSRIILLLRWGWCHRSTTVVNQHLLALSTVYIPLLYTIGCFHVIALLNYINGMGDEAMRGWPMLKDAFGEEFGKRHLKSYEVAHQGPAGHMPISM